MTIKKIGVLSMGKVMGALYALLGLVFGLFYGLIIAVAGIAGQASGGGELGAGLGLGLGFGAVVILPIFYGLIGLVGGFVTALLYNLIAGMIGGIEIEVDGDPSLAQRFD